MTGSAASPSQEAGAARSADTLLPPSPAEIVSIQYLRGFAAAMVAVHHAFDQFPQVHAWLPNGVGSTGVDMFFVISGFVMTYTTGLKPIGAGAFLARRFVRIAPLYWLLTLFTAALLIAAPHLVRRSLFTMPSFIQSMLFIPHWNPADATSFSPMLKLGWTLNYEMIFYLVFSLFLGFSLRARLIGVAGIFALLFVARWIFGTPSALLAVYGSPMVFEFIMGCLLGALDLPGLTARIPRRAGWALILGGAIALMPGAYLQATDWRVLACGLPAMAIVAGLLVVERGGVRFDARNILGRLGDASYSIYLSHLYAVIFFRILWEKAGLPVDGFLAAMAFVLCCAGTGIAAGLFTYYLVERPLTRRLAPLVRRRRPIPA